MRSPNLIAIWAPTTALTRVCERIRAAQGACILVHVPSDPALARAIRDHLQTVSGVAIELLTAPVTIAAGQVWLSVEGLHLTPDGELSPRPDPTGDALLLALARHHDATAWVLGDHASPRIGVAAMCAAGHSVIAPEPDDAAWAAAGLSVVLIDDAGRLVRALGAAPSLLKPVGRPEEPIDARVIEPWQAAVRAALVGDPPPSLGPGRVTLRRIGPDRRALHLIPAVHGLVSRPASLLDDMPVLAAYIDADLRLVQVNQPAAAVLKLSVDTATGRHLIDAMPALATRMKVYRRVLRGEAIDLTDVFIRGRHYDFNLRPAPGGGLVIIGHDVTEREQARSRLQHVADVLSAVPLGVVTIRQMEPGPGGFVIDSVHASAWAHLPVDLEATLGQRLQSIFPRWFVTGVPEALIRVLRTRVREQVHTTFQPGTPIERHLRLHISWLANDLVVVTIDDVSQMVDMQRRQLAAQRLETLGKLAGGLAHDLNGRLTTILTNAERIRARIATPEPIDAVLTATHYAADLIAQLLAFAQQGPVDPQLTTAEAIVKRVLPMLRTLMGEAVTIEATLPTDPWPVFIDPGALQRVLLDLAENARAAMPTGGQLRITVRQHADTAGDTVHIDVADTGAGMDPTTRERCFEPYYSSKPMATNSGLGLSAVLGTLQQAGGTVQIESAEGVGTTVRLILPRKVEPPPRISRPIMQQSARILLVEPEDLLRTIVARQLKRVGHRVTTASDATTAQAAIEAHGAFDLLFTAVVMPGENGVALARALRRQDPALRVLFMSRYPDHAAVRTDQGSVGDLLVKPFSERDLRAAIKAALRDPQPAPAPDKIDGA